MTMAPLTTSAIVPPAASGCVNQTVMPTRACAPRILTDTLRVRSERGAKHPPSTPVAAAAIPVSSVAPPSRRPEAWKLAGSIVRYLRRGALNGRHGAERPSAVSLSLSCRSGDEAEVRVKLAEFIDVVADRAPVVAQLCALDRSPSGKWHVHALALIPPGFDVAKLTRWWRRRWPRKTPNGDYLRPSKRGQHFRRLALGRELKVVLAHHLGSSRVVEGVRVPIVGLPSLPDRVRAYGALADVWKRVCDKNGITLPAGAVSLKKRPSRPRKVSTVPSPPGQAWTPGASCAWCGKTFPTGKRKGSRYCGRTCGSAASRALKSFERRVDDDLVTDARDRVVALEANGWLRRDAIQAVTIALAESAKNGIPIAEAAVGMPLCRCGRPMPARGNAKTCGDSRCRMKNLRKRAREQRRLNSWYKRLLRAYRSGTPFFRADAFMIARSTKALRREVERVLFELEEDGCIEARGPGVFAFAPLPSRPRAA